MSDIGFRIKDNQDFMRFLTQAAQEGEVIPVGDGSYVKWSPGTGIELWVQLDREHEIIGLNPHYSGRATLRIGLTKRVPRPQGTLLDGAFYGWANPDEGEPETGEFPFVFDVPNYKSYDDLKLPAIVAVQVAAFAHELQGFENETAFDESQAEDMNLAVESFIPTGLFIPKESSEPPQAEAIFAGHILDTAILTNPATDADFLWARVSTLGGEIEVVADPEILEGSLVKGGIIKGSFWLTGRVLNPQVWKSDAQ
jgi:hypothetical protein